MARIKLMPAVKGSTLIEVLVAMVVIVTVFGIAMMIFNNVLRYGAPEKQIRAKAVLKDILYDIKEQQKFHNQSIADGDLMIQVNVSPYADSNSLVLIKLTAFDKNQREQAQLLSIITERK